MATYKYAGYLQVNTSDAFDSKHTPGTAAPYPGIYRCTSCGDEIGIAGGHTLPPQNHKQHNSSAEIKWQLVVYAVQK